MIETIGIMCGIALGLFGSVLSVIQFFYQRYKDKEQAKIQDQRDKEQAEIQAQRDKEQAERQAQRDREQAERQAQRDKEQAERQAQRDREQAKRDKEQAEKQDLKDRLFFLAQVIIDKDIPRESRQPFFDEYIQKGGNGTFIKFWLEGEKKGEAQR